jgi:hypothetical protein
MTALSGSLQREGAKGTNNMQKPFLCRQIEVAFLQCANDAKVPSDRDQFLAAAIHYHQLARVIEEGRT